MANKEEKKSVEEKCRRTKDTLNPAIIMLHFFLLFFFDLKFFYQNILGKIYPAIVSLINIFSNTRKYCLTILKTILYNAKKYCFILKIFYTKK